MIYNKTKNILSFEEEILGLSLDLHAIKRDLLRVYSGSQEANKNNKYSVKITDQQVLDIFKLYKEGNNWRQISELTGVSISSMRDWFYGESRNDLFMLNDVSFTRRKNKKKTITDHIVRMVVQRHAEGWSVRRIAKEYKISKTHVHRITKNPNHFMVFGRI